jgi:hypothetical protein
MSIKMNEDRTSAVAESLSEIEYLEERKVLDSFDINTQLTNRIIVFQTNFQKIMFHESHGNLKLIQYFSFILSLLFFISYHI